MVPAPFPCSPGKNRPKCIGAASSELHLVPNLRLPVMTRCFLWSRNALSYISCLSVRGCVWWQLYIWGDSSHWCSAQMPSVSLMWATLVDTPAPFKLSGPHSLRPKVQVVLSCLHPLSFNLALGEVPCCGFLMRVMRIPRVQVLSLDVSLLCLLVPAFLAQTIIWSLTMPRFAFNPVSSYALPVPTVQASPRLPRFSAARPRPILAGSSSKGLLRRARIFTMPSGLSDRTPRASLSRPSSLTRWRSAPATSGFPSRRFACA